MIHINEEAACCLLCENAPCGEKTARAIRALRLVADDAIYPVWTEGIRLSRLARTANRVS